MCDYCAHKFYDYHCEDCISEILPNTRYGRTARQSSAVVGAALSCTLSMVIGLLIVSQFNLHRFFGDAEVIVLCLTALLGSYFVAGKALEAFIVEGTQFRLSLPRSRLSFVSSLVIAVLGIATLALLDLRNASAFNDLVSLRRLLVLFIICFLSTMFSCHVAIAQLSKELRKSMKAPPKPLSEQSENA